MNRSKLISQLEQDNTEVWDILVIGGGATGLGIALDAASRGLKTILLEKKDFASETSSCSTKLSHGGIRYLQTLDFKNLLDSAEEQNLMQTHAPHLVSDIEFILPTKNLFQYCYIRLGLIIFDLLTSLKKRKYKLSFNRSKGVSLKSILKIFPKIKTASVFAGVSYTDCQFDDARFALNLAKKATEFGAITLNYFEVQSLLKDNDKISGVVARDLESGKSYKIKSKLVINATGPFSDSIIKLDNKNTERIIDPVQGTHVVLPLRFLDSQTALIIPKTKRGRVFYAIPWMNHLLLGTTETRLKVEDGRFPQASPAATEIKYLLEEFSLHFNSNPCESDILAKFSGVRPLINKENDKSDGYASRDHSIFSSASGLITIAGGKWTTYRKMAVDTIDFAIIHGNFIKIPSKTDYISFVSTTDYNLAPDHLRCYGDHALELKKLEDENPKLAELLHSDYSYTWSCVYWAVHNECAIHLEDVLLRRTRLLLLNSRVAKEVAPRVAWFMANELREGDFWVDRELHLFAKSDLAS